MNEFAICWVKGDAVASVTAPSSSWLKGRMLKLRDRNPDEVTVHENKDGSILAYCPVRYIKVSPPRKVSEEQKAASRERMQKMWGKEHTDDSEYDWPDDWEEDEEDEG